MMLFIAPLIETTGGVLPPKAWESFVNRSGRSHPISSPNFEIVFMTATSA